MKLRCHPIVVSCLLAVTVLPSAAVPAGLPVTGQPWESGLCKGTAAVMHCAAALLSASCSAAAVINCAAGLLLASCSVAMTVPPSAALPAAGLPVTCQTSESDLLKGSTAIIHYTATLLSVSCSAPAVIHSAASLPAACSVAVTGLSSAAVPAIILPVTGQTWESGLCKGIAAFIHCAATLLLALCCLVGWKESHIDLNMRFVQEGELCQLKHWIDPDWNS